jgi:hypothetical protein
MVALAVVLALVGVAALVIAAKLASKEGESPPTPPAEPDLAAPYREGLHTAIRLQLAARDFEQQIYTEATRLKRDQP